MSQEIRLQLSLQIRKGVLVYQSNPTALIADMLGSSGPTPGTIHVALGTGLDISLSQIVIPGGWCFIMNLDPTVQPTPNFIEYGINDVSNFFPLGELLPGEFAIFRLSRNVGKEYVGTGTGVANSTFRIKAHGAATLARVEVFDA
jgi:hypothetical protein